MILIMIMFLIVIVKKISFKLFNIKQLVYKILSKIKIQILYLVLLLILEIKYFSILEIILKI